MQRWRRVLSAGGSSEWAEGAGEGLMKVGRRRRRKWARERGRAGWTWQLGEGTLDRNEEASWEGPGVEAGREGEMRRTRKPTSNQPRARGAGVHQAEGEQDVAGCSLLGLSDREERRDGAFLLFDLERWGERRLSQGL